MIRPATVADAEAVATLETENLGGDAWPHGLVAAGVAGAVPTVRYLVAEEAGVVVGYAAASVVADLAELQRIAVTSSSRRAGVASRLLMAVVAAACDERADRLLLEVREENAGALAFYASHDFVEIDRRQRYFRDGATAVVMRLSLNRGGG